MFSSPSNNINTGFDQAPVPGNQENCCICITPIDSRCRANGDCCSHQFCYQCLLTWSKTNAVCPLCTKTFTKILHNYTMVNGVELYDVFEVPFVPPPPPPPTATRRRPIVTIDLTEDDDEAASSSPAPEVEDMSSEVSVSTTATSASESADSDDEVQIIYEGPIVKGLRPPPPTSTFDSSTNQSESVVTTEISSTTTSSSEPRASSSEPTTHEDAVDRPSSRSPEPSTSAEAQKALLDRKHRNWKRRAIFCEVLPKKRLGPLSSDLVNQSMSDSGGGDGNDLNEKERQRYERTVGRKLEILTQRAAAKLKSYLDYFSPSPIPFFSRLERAGSGSETPSASAPSSNSEGQYLDVTRRQADASLTRLTSYGIIQDDDNEMAMAVDADQNYGGISGATAETPGSPADTPVINVPALLARGIYPCDDCPVQEIAENACEIYYYLSGQGVDRSAHEVDSELKTAIGLPNGERLPLLYWNNDSTWNVDTAEPHLITGEPPCSSSPVLYLRKPPADEEWRFYQVPTYPVNSRKVYLPHIGLLNSYNLTGMIEEAESLKITTKLYFCDIDICYEQFHPNFVYLVEGVPKLIVFGPIKKEQILVESCVEAVELGTGPEFRAPNYYIAEEDEVKAD